MAKESIAPISAKHMAFAIQRLEAILASCKEFKEYADDVHEGDELWVWRFDSLEKGLIRLESIVPELRRSVYAHTTGSPQSSNSKKSK